MPRPSHPPEVAAAVASLRAAGRTDREIADALGLSFFAARALRKRAAGPGRVDRSMEPTREMRLRLSTAAAEALHALAKERGVTVSELVRSILEAA